MVPANENDFKSIKVAIVCPINQLVTFKIGLDLHRWALLAVILKLLYLLKDEDKIKMIIK